MGANNKATSNNVPNVEPVLGTLTSSLPHNYQSEPAAKTQTSVNAVPKTLGEHVYANPRLVSVKHLASLYGLKMGAIYGFIKTDPDFPYVNVGLKKKFMVDIELFELWLKQRTVKEKTQQFDNISVDDLLNLFKGR